MLKMIVIRSCALRHGTSRYLTVIKRYSALDVSPLPKSTHSQSKPPSITSKRTPTRNPRKRNNPVPKSSTNPLPIPSVSPSSNHETTALTPPSTAPQSSTAITPTVDNMDGDTYHFPRRTLCDSVWREQTLNGFDWVKVSRLQRPPYSLYQKRWIENLFHFHSIGYIVRLFELWGIETKLLGKGKDSKSGSERIHFDRIYVRIEQKVHPFRGNGHSMQLMLRILFYLLSQHQHHHKRVVPFLNIIRALDGERGSDHKLSGNEDDNKWRESDTMKILQSFRQFVVHHDKERIMKNPGISVWAQIGNILQLDTVQQHNDEQYRYFEKAESHKKLEGVLRRHSFYRTICLFYQIYGAPKGAPNQPQSTTMLLPISDSRTVRVSEDDLVLKLDSNVLSVLDSNGLNPTNLPSILNRIQSESYGLTEILMDGTWSIYNDIQCTNDLSLIVIPLQIHRLMSSMNPFRGRDARNNQNQKNQNDENYKIDQNQNDQKSHSESLSDDNIFQWLGARCFSLEAGSKESEFKVMGIGGDVLNRRKLWFLISFLPNCLGANFMKMDQVSVLWWLSVAVKGWEFEFEHFVTPKIGSSENMKNPKNKKSGNYENSKNKKSQNFGDSKDGEFDENKESEDDQEQKQKLFECHCTEYRRIIKDILRCKWREDLIASNGGSLLSRLAMLYLNDLMPSQWLSDDWLVLAKLCPLIMGKERVQEPNPLLFLTESLEKMDRVQGGDVILGKMKALIHDEQFVVRLSKSLKGNNESYIEFLESLCSADDGRSDESDGSGQIVDTAAMHLFMDRVLYPSADFVSALSALKLMMRHSILMNMDTISLFLRICELANNPNLMHDVYCKLQSTLNTKLCQNADILKCLLRVFLKHKQWHWMDSVVQNVYAENADDGESENNAVPVVVEKCVLEMIEVLVVLNQPDHRRDTHTQHEVPSIIQSDDIMKAPLITLNKQFVTDIIVSVLDGKKQDEAINKMLIEMFTEYKRYMEVNRDHIASRKQMKQEPYIMLKLNIVQDLIAQSTNTAMLQKWDQLILKLNKK